MRMGAVVVDMEIPVDLDNEDMVNEAIQCLHEDICNAVKHNEVGDLIVVEENDELDPSMIPSFLFMEDDLVS